VSKGSPVDIHEIEHTLWSFLDAGTGPPVRWLHLRSHEGAGNTRLLTRMKEQLDRAARWRRARVIFVPAPGEGDAVAMPGLGPLGNILFHLDQINWLRGTALFLSRFRNTPTRVKVRIAVKKTLLFALAVLLVLWGTYLSQSEIQEFATYLQKTPDTTTLVLMGAVALLTNRVLNIIDRDEFAEAEARTPGATALEPYRRPSGLANRLAAVAGDRQTLVLLVDDLHKLPKAELYFLRNLASSRQTLPPGVESSEARQILIVTVDPTGTVDVPSNAQIEDVSAPPLGERTAASDEHHRTRARALLDLVTGGKQGIWGLADLLALSVADMYESRTQRQWLDILSTARGAPFSRHLTALQLLAARSVRGLVRQLASTPLITIQGRSLYRDRKVAGALRALLAEEHPALLAQAHLFWARFYESAVPAEGIELVHHHLAEAASLALDEVEAYGAEPALTRLLDASRVWREEGDVETSTRALRLAKALLARRGDDARADLVDRFAEERALHYGTFALPLDDGPDDELPMLVNNRIWQIHQRCVSYLRSARKPEPIDDAGLPPAVQNLNRASYAEAWVWTIGENWLFHPPIEGAEEAPLADGGEFRLLALQVRQLVARYTFDKCRVALGRYRQRLQDTRPAERLLGLDAMWRLQQALYLDLLHAWWRQESNLLPDWERDTPYGQELVATARQLCLEPVEDLDKELPVQARAAFEHCLALANLLSLRAVQIRATQGLGQLLHRTSESFHGPGGDWWRSWDHLFDAALGMADDLGWIELKAGILWHRWSFFRTLDIRAAALDGLAFYEQALLTDAPDPVLAHWSSTIRVSLTGVTLPAEADVRLGAIWLDWCRLLDNPDVGSTVAKVDLERLKALLFATQSFQSGHDLDRAVATLAKAQALARTIFGTLAPLPKLGDADARAALYLFCRQCLVLHEDGCGDGIPTFKAGDVWKIFRRDDYYLPSALHSLLLDDADSLRKPWTPDAGALDDPSNPWLALETSDPRTVAPPRTWCEYRVRQLLGWFTGDSYAQADVVAGRVAGRWKKFTRPHESLFILAEAALDMPEMRPLDAIIIAFLQALHQHVAHDVPIDDIQRRTLALLIRYEPETPRWRELYLDVSAEIEALLEREAAHLDDRGNVNCLALLLTAQSYLEPLQSSSLVQAFEHQDATFADAQREREAILAECESALKAGLHADGWDLLQDYLSAGDPVPVTFLHIRVLDLADRCAAGAPALHDHRAAIHRRLETQALEYVRRFASTIPEQRGQELARRVLALLQRHITRRETTAASGARP
jgi:hypothetical protein